MKSLAFCLPFIVVSACAPGILPVLPTVSFVVDVPPLPAALYPLDGQWVLADFDGGRSCLVVQESRVSILDLTCSTDGRGFVGRILESPLVSRAGQAINLSVTYYPRSFETIRARLSFVGQVQPDGTFIGARTDILFDSGDSPRTVQSILSRS